MVGSEFVDVYNLHGNRFESQSTHHLRQNKKLFDCDSNKLLAQQIQRYTER